jgi:antitoxin (DNA-binding transcriptional repressor) of toxin-antitoxin stability system
MSNIQVNMHEAKSNLSKLAEQVLSGDKVVIAKAGKPYLDLTLHNPNKKRQAGHYKDQIVIADDFDKTPTDIIEDFGI